MQNSNTQFISGALLKTTLALLACLLTACSAIRLGYSNGDSVTYWWLNSYIDFQDDQKAQVKEDIGQFFLWHRKTQLPDYAQLLNQWQSDLQHEVTLTEVTENYGAIKKRALVMIDHALPDLAALALALHPEQIAHLEKKFSSNNENYRKEYLQGDLEDRQLHRYKKVMKQAEYWFGNFSREQEERIRAASDARPLDNEWWLGQRMRRQHEMVAMLKRIQAEKPTQDAVVKMLRDYVKSSMDSFGSTEDKMLQEKSQDATFRLITTIINLTTPEQKAHAAKRIQQWIKDCHDLAAKQ